MRSQQAVANPYLKINKEAPVSASQATEVASKERIRNWTDGNGIITKEKGDFIWRQIHQHQNWFFFFIIHISLIFTSKPAYTRNLCDKHFLFHFLAYIKLRKTLLLLTHAPCYAAALIFFYYFIFSCILFTLYFISCAFLVQLDTRRHKNE